MKRKVTTITEEYDKDGKIISKITETVEEEDNGYIYPQNVPTYPHTSPITTPNTPWDYRHPTCITCNTEKTDRGEN